MCGIAGIYSHSPGAGPVDGEELLRIRDTMSNRGPDGEGVWTSKNGRVGLAHRRLAIIDLSENGAQPMSSLDGSACITFNGEIYNYQSLRRQLEAKGYAFRTGSDTEVLLQLYADQGREMLHSLRGMFAFGIWDARQQGLFLARDPFGIKPLYYADDGRTVRFASQVKALLRGGEIDDAMEPAGYVGFLTWGCVPEPFTLYRDIRALGAGSSIWIDSKGLERPLKYFSVGREFLAAENSRPVLSRPDAIALVHDALKSSVSHHLIADVPVAAFLSAGLDSATTVAMASGVSNPNLRTLTLGFEEYEGTPNDETSLAALIASRFDATHETRWVQRADFEQAVEDIFDAMDQPSTDGVNTYLISKAASNAGIKVALSGLGGDELFAGYPSFRDVPRMRRLAMASRIGREAGRALRRVSSPIFGKLSSPKYAGLLEYGSTNAGAYLLRRALFMPWEIQEILGEDIARQGWETLQTLARLDESIEGLRTDRAIVSTLEIDWYMRNQLLRDCDWAGMAHSIEIRIPYVDVEFFRAILPVLTSGHSISKADVAGALQPPLPEAVLKRGKTGFLVPVQQWCSTATGQGPLDRGLRGWARIVLGKALAKHGDTEPKVLRQRYFGAPLNFTPPSDLAGRNWRRRSQAALAQLAYKSINGALATCARLRWPYARPKVAERICVFRIGNIGDIVCALPAMRCIRNAYPNAELTLLTSPGPRGMAGAAEVIQGATWIDHLWIYNSEDIDTHAKRMKFLAETRKRRFDIWIDLPNNLTTAARQLRDMAFAALAGVKWARGWRVDTIRWAAQAQSENLFFANEVDRLLDVVRNAGFPSKTADFGLAREASVIERVSQVLHARRIVGDKLVAIAPGAKRSTNLWVNDRYEEVARNLMGHGFVPIFMGGKGDAPLCNQLQTAVGGSSRSLAGELSVSESCELMRRCSLAICLDSGVQHIASAVGTPCISLFSFWQMRGKWHPYGARNVVLQKWVSCHTCLLEECPNENRCMKAIEVNEVMAHAQRMLDIVPAATRRTVR